MIVGYPQMECDGLNQFKILQRTAAQVSVCSLPWQPLGLKDSSLEPSGSIAIHP